MPVHIYEVQLEERFSTGELGQHRNNMRLRPQGSFGLSVHQAEIDVKAQFFRYFFGHDERSTGPLRGRVAIDLSHFQKFVAFTLHEIELLRRIGAVPNFGRTLLLLELHFHRRKIDRKVIRRRMRNTPLKFRISL